MRPRIAPELETSGWLNSDGPVTLASLRGRVVLIEAFQMLCPGCVSHGLPQAKRVAETFADSDVVVLGLHTVFEHHEVQGSEMALRPFLHEYGISFPVGIDAHDEGERLPRTMKAYGMRGTPTLALIDRSGRLRHLTFGAVQDMVVGAHVMALVRETAQDTPECDEAGCLA